MTKLVKAAILSVAALVVGAGPVAAVDYEINGDVDFPSVVFIDFDPATMPVVLQAPKVSALPVIGGGRIDMQDQSPGADQRREDERSEEAAAGERRQARADQRAEARVDELSRPGSQELEDIIIDRGIEDRVLEEFDLRN